VIVPPELALLTQHRRERDLSHDYLARVAACYRACCNPTLLDRIARAIGLAPTAC
jgi:hypothetical protein